MTPWPVRGRRPTRTVRLLMLPMYEGDLVDVSPRYVRVRASGVFTGVLRAIHKAEALLPSATCDPRWQAIIDISNYIRRDECILSEAELDAVWAFIHNWGTHPDEDMRTAIAVCLLEHFIEYHFQEYFGRVEAAALAEPLFADTFSRCWQLGQALEPANAERFAALGERFRLQGMVTDS